jgi:hypothetical protein
MKRLLLLFLLIVFSTSVVGQVDSEEGRIAVKGGIANASIAWLGPILSATFKLSAGGEYWFNKNWALGFDFGMGGEGYGKVIGTTSHSLVNLKTGDFILDPGISGTYAFDPMGHFRLYGALRLGFPFYSGYPAAISIGPSFGTLIALNDWAFLDVGASISVVATFKFNYLATVLSLGSIGFRVLI